MSEQNAAAMKSQSSKSWIRQPLLVSLNLRLVIVLLSATTLGFDGSMMNGLQSLSTWRDYFDTPNAKELGTINAMLPLGVVLGAAPAGWMADKYGRKPTIAFGTIVLIGAAILQGASQNLPTFIVSRFIIGLGVEFTVIPAPVLITELAFPEHRGKITSLYQTCFYLGAIASSWTTFGTFHITGSTWSWRIPSILQALFPIVQLATIYFVPESPRWLINRGRIEEARAFIINFHAGGDASAPIVEAEMNEMVTHLEKEADIAGTEWLSLIKTKSDKKRLAVALFVAVIGQWSGSGIITYYLTLVLNSVGITDPFDQTLINGILQIFNFFAAVLGAFLVDRCGRRRLWLFSLFGMLWTFVVLTACSAEFARTQGNALGVVVIVFLFIYFFHYDIAVTPLSFAYPAEIMPFHTRQKTMSLVYGANGLLLLFNSFVNPIALEAIAWRYYVLYIVLIAVMLVVVYLFYPETRGLTLEAIADVFDGPSLVYKQKSARPRESIDKEAAEDKQSTTATVQLIEESK